MPPKQEKKQVDHIKKEITKQEAKDSQLKTEVTALKNELKMMKAELQKAKSVPQHSAQEIQDREEAAKIAAYIMDPFDHSPKQYPTSFSVGEVTPAKPWRLYDNVWSQSTDKEKAAQFMTVAVTREPLAAYYSTLVFDNTSTGSYRDKTVQPNSVGPSHMIDRMIADLSTGCYGPLQFTGNYPYVNNIHDSTIYSGHSTEGNSRFYYPLNPRDRMSFNLGVSQANYPVGFTMTIYSVVNALNSVAILTSANADTNGYIYWSPEVFGFYSFCLSSTAPYKITFSNTYTGFGIDINGNPNRANYEPVFISQHALPDLTSRIAEMDACQITAATMLVSNISNLRTRGGNVAHYQVPGSEWWFDYANNDRAFRAQGSKTTQAELGKYSWTDITQAYDMDYRPIVCSNIYCFNLDSISDVNVITLNVPYDVEGCGRSFQTYFCFGIWYKNGSTMNLKYASSSTSVVADHVKLCLTKSPRSFENPLHLKDIRDMISKVIGVVVKHGPTVIKGAKALGTLLL